MSKYEARFSLCGNEESSCDDECALPVADFTFVVLLFSIAQKHSLAARHLKFQNALRNGILARPVHIKLSKHVNTNTGIAAQVLKLNRSLYVLKNAAKIWYNTILKNVWERIYTN